MTQVIAHAADCPVLCQETISARVEDLPDGTRRHYWACVNGHLWIGGDRHGCHCTAAAKLAKLVEAAAFFLTDEPEDLETIMAAQERLDAALRPFRR